MSATDEQEIWGVDRDGTGKPTLSSPANKKHKASDVSVMITDNSHATPGKHKSKKPSSASSSSGGRGSSSSSGPKIDLQDLRNRHHDEDDLLQAFRDDVEEDSHGDGRDGIAHLSGGFGRSGSEDEDGLDDYMVSTHDVHPSLTQFYAAQSSPSQSASHPSRNQNNHNHHQHSVEDDDSLFQQQLPTSIDLEEDHRDEDEIEVRNPSVKKTHVPFS